MRIHTVFDARPVVTVPRSCMAAFGPLEGLTEIAPFMDARGAMVTELALYRFMFQPPPVGGPGGLAREWLDSAYAQAALNGPVWRNCARNGPTFGHLARCATAARTARPCRYPQSPPPILAQMWPSILRIRVRVESVTGVTFSISVLRQSDRQEPNS